MFGILDANAFEQRTGLGRLFLAEETLAQVALSIDVLRVAFQCGPVTGLGLVQFALLEINIAQLEIMVRFVEMMDLGLEFLNPGALVRPWKLKAARG